MDFPIASAKFLNDPGIKFLTFLLSTLMLAAVILLFFFGGRPEHKVYPGNNKDICSTNLSADDYQTCKVITDEGHDF